MVTQQSTFTLAPYIQFPSPIPPTRISSQVGPTSSPASDSIRRTVRQRERVGGPPTKAVHGAHDRDRVAARIVQITGHAHEALRARLPLHAVGQLAPPWPDALDRAPIADGGVGRGIAEASLARRAHACQAHRQHRDAHAPRRQNEAARPLGQHSLQFGGHAATLPFRILRHENVEHRTRTAHGEAIVHSSPMLKVGHRDRPWLWRAPVDGRQQARVRACEYHVRVMDAGSRLLLSDEGCGAAHAVVSPHEVHRGGRAVPERLLPELRHHHREILRHVDVRLVLEPEAAGVREAPVGHVVDWTDAVREGRRPARLHRLALDQ
mmetsp:Transcript_55116/g.126749  ORF Transcript_55116/g.126749 Transcript_55116/m.126749 type:complete len:322 (+) Transcript_55116:584-1549(+)